MDLSSLIFYLDILLFVIVSGTVLYLLVFAIAALVGKAERRPHVRKNNRILVLIPAYKEDFVIESTVRSLLRQSYPSTQFDVVVIADHCKVETVEKLSQYPITVLTPDFEESLKAKSLNYAMEYIAPRKYDVVVILDADNTVAPHFLEVINSYYESGCMAMQAHRVAKNRNTETALLDAIFEEINNSIFRTGHVRLGFSSALVGSGMAFDFEWFRQNVGKLISAGEDKELEILLMKQGIFVDFLDNLYVYDEKTQKEKTFHRQRRRWMAAQVNSLISNVPKLIPALVQRNYDLVDKIIQWMLLPRIPMIGIILVMSVVMLAVDWTSAIKWWCMFLVVLGTFAMCVPDDLVNEDFDRAIKRAPLMAVKMLLNVFRLRGLKKKFLHTEHSITTTN